jgi:DNA primase
LRDSRSEIEEIKSRAGIVDVVSEYVALKKAGRNFIGLCPFHKEKTPSFSVNAERQIFYCFGCGSGGDVFEFIMKVNNMSFSEALSHLAEKTGIVIQKKRPEGVSAEKTLREDVKRINRFAGEHFIRNLNSGSGKGARDYLRQRRINDETVREFRLGFAVAGWRQLRDLFEKSRIPLPLAEKAGLVIRGEKGDFYDRFRGRLIFPIQDIAGEFIAFGGRASGDEKPKYLNSPESPVYTKGRNLYGLNRAKDEIRKKGYVILVEGYFDVLSLWNAGIRNVVAALGTALTREHLDLLRRFTTDIVAIFDPDEGGRSALERSLVLFLEEKFQARVVILPENLDPDDYIKKHGAESMEQMIKNSQSVIDYYIENVIGANHGFEADVEAIRKAIPLVGKIGDLVQRNLFVKRISEKLNIEQALLKTEVQRSLQGRMKRPSLKATESPEKENHQEALDAVELTLIRLLVHFPENFSEYVEAGVFDFFLNPELKLAGQQLAKALKAREANDFLSLIKGVENQTLRKKMIGWSIDESPFEGVDAARLLEDTVKKIKMKWSRARYKDLKFKLHKAEARGDSDLVSRLTAELDQINKSRMN